MDPITGNVLIDMIVVATAAVGTREAGGMIYKRMNGGKTGTDRVVTAVESVAFALEKHDEGDRRQHDAILSALLAQSIVLGQQNEVLARLLERTSK